MQCWQNMPGACRTLESSAANRPRRPLFCRFLAPARGTPDSYALKRYDSAAPWNNHAAANPAKNGIVRADFRYRRPKSDRLLACFASTAWPSPSRITPFCHPPWAANSSAHISTPTQRMRSTIANPPAKPIGRAPDPPIYPAGYAATPQPEPTRISTR